MSRNHGMLSLGVESKQPQGGPEARAVTSCCANGAELPGGALRLKHRTAAATLQAARAKVAADAWTAVE